MNKPTFRQKLRSELETKPEERKLGSGWLSGLLAFLFSVAALFLSLCRAFPGVFIMPELRPIFDHPWFSLGLMAVMVAGFALALLNLVLRPNRILGLTAIGLTLIAGFIAQFGSVETSREGLFFGLDFFVLNVVLTGLLFVPIERAFPLKREQRLFRTEWREDLFYYFVSSMMVQVLTYLAMAPANAINAANAWEGFRAAVFALPMVVQVVLIMFFTDFVQYWLHRAFHRVPALWRFHAVHHSAKSMDWIAGARMHFLEVIVLRGVTAIPMFTLGFNPLAIQIYLLIVYFYSAFIHANVGWNLKAAEPYVATPRFHHWHHGEEREAIDVNFAIHFPLFDRLFGTHHMPETRWPKAYGIKGHPVPLGYWKQFLYPFKR
ncbi:sterol desaturase family protein [Hyphomonas sp.]|uniref:sterol desaturase family protein n=1 Tax=Hyphomonas sp. TaxID=87 RepID=UPI0025BCCC1D|nr:sterol desaturase family protein [Hyphomonas sp.]